MSVPNEPAAPPPASMAVTSWLLVEVVAEASLDCHLAAGVDGRDLVEVGRAAGQAGVGKRTASNTGHVRGAALAVAAGRAIDVVAGGPGRATPAEHDLTVAGLGREFLGAAGASSP